MTTRVYVPSTLHRLREIVTAQELGPAPFAAHAVTEAVRRELGDGGDEEREYAASSAAAQSAVGLLRADEPARRMVLAVDVPGVRDAGSEDPTEVTVGDVVPLGLVAAVLVDSREAEATVAAARDAVAGADRDRCLARCLDHELGWWAAQEVHVLLDGLDAR